MVAACAVATILALSPASAESTPRRPATAAAAGPACSVKPAGRQSIKDVPYAQRRFSPDRLAPLATGAGVLVAVLDSGVDATHPQLSGRVRPGRDFLRNAIDARRDCNGHGTGVASIIAGRPTRPADRAFGFQGLAPGAGILPVRVSEQQQVDDERPGGNVSPAVFAESIRWAVDQDAKVVNLSVTMRVNDPAVADAVRYAAEHDVVLVAAVGNLGGGQDGNPTPYPAAYPDVLGVGAIGPDGLATAYSQRGSYVDVVAPGQLVTMAAVGGGHRQDSGTSFAAPFVSGAAALVRDRFPRLTARQVVTRIVATADPAPGGQRSDRYGHGVVNPYRALTETLATGEVRQPAQAPPRPSDPATAATQRRRERAAVRSFVVAGVGVGVAATALLLAALVPCGVRRRWRAAGQPQASGRWASGR